MGSFAAFSNSNMTGDQLATSVAAERPMGGVMELQPLVLADDETTSASYGSSSTGSSPCHPDHGVIQDEKGNDEQTSFKNHGGYRENKISLQDWCLSTHEPRPVQLARLENVAIPACYLCVGLSQGLSRTLLNVYPLDLGATEAQQTAISSIAMLPCTFKILFGFLSDQVPLLNTRRKGYMALGWTVASLSMMTLLWLSDLTLRRRHSIDKASIVVDVPDNAPSIELLSLMFLIFGTGFWMADVMGDSIVAERAKLEPDESRGQLQSTCYACRFFGMMVAAPCSTVLYSHFGPRIVVVVMAASPIVIMFPAIYKLRELAAVRVLSAREQCDEMWSSVCSRVVWQPMGFVFVYNILQMSNAAWRQFLNTVLGFTPNQLNALLIAAYILLYLGTLAYKYYFIRFSWRLIYQVGILLNGIFSSLQVLLILGITFGISPFWFALGDDVFSDLIGGIQFLPCTIMMVHLCPSGSEGASYALFTTMWNSALLLAPALSTMLLPIWDVSVEALEEGRLSGLLKLTVLTTLIQMSAVLFVGLLPNDRHDLELLKKKQFSKSRVGGAIFLAVVFSSTMYSASVGILNIIVPGWAGES